MSPNFEADLDFLLSKLYKFICLKVLFNKSKKLYENQTWKVIFWTMTHRSILIMVLSEEPSNLWLVYKMLINDVNNTSTYHHTSVIPNIDTYLPN